MLEEIGVVDVEDNEVDDDDDDGVGALVETMDLISAFESLVSGVVTGDGNEFDSFFFTSSNDIESSISFLTISLIRVGAFELVVTASFSNGGSCFTPDIAPVVGVVTDDVGVDEGIEMKSSRGSDLI